MLSVLVFLVALSQALVPTACERITGTVDSAIVTDDQSHLQVIVRSDAGGIVECVPVTSALTFSLHRVVERDGFHVVELSGSAEWDFAPFIITLTNGSLTSAYRRMNPLELPSGIRRADDTLTIHFTSSTRTAYTPVRSRWRLTSLVTPYRLLFVAGFALIVAFPHFFRQLPKDMREELTGEMEPDTGDPNRVIKALIGDPTT